jgi:uncharacterized protein (TIGR02996 family)
VFAEQASAGLSVGGSPYQVGARYWIAAENVSVRARASSPIAGAVTQAALHAVDTTQAADAVASGPTGPANYAAAAAKAANAAAETTEVIRSDFERLKVGATVTGDEYSGAPNFFGPLLPNLGGDFTRLMTAVIADAGDNTVRGVLADWLEENGWSKWAEFIRVQIRYSQLTALEGTRTPEEHVEREVTWRRERKLLGSGVWYFALLLDGSGWQIHDVERGFPHRIDPCSCDWWIRMGDDIRTRLPITSVRFPVAPEFEESDGGVLFVGDPRGTPVLVPTELRGNESLLRSALQLRWPGVHFDLHDSPAG